MTQAHMSGARLAYVVTPLNGEVKREICTWDKKGGGIKRKLVDQPAGFMVYFPRGHAIRLKSEAELARYGLDKPAEIINLTGLADRNSPLGKLLSAQDDDARRGAMNNLELAVIQLATAKTGPVLMPEQLHDRIAE